MPGIDGYEQFGAKAAAAATSENFEGTAGAGGVRLSMPVLRCGVKRVLLKSWCGGTA